MIRCKKIDKFGLIFLAVILTISGINGQELDPCKFFPLNEGDYWKYSVNAGTMYEEYHIFKVTYDEYGTKYAYMYESEPNRPTWSVDTNYNVYQDPNYPRLYYKLGANVGDSWIIGTYDSTSFDMARVENIFEGSFLGKETIFKEISFYAYFLDIDSLYHEYELYREVLAYEIGLVLRTLDVAYPTTLISAVVAGDTLGNIVGIETATDLQKDFKIYQNYPNPFNPTTRINYSLPESGNIQIILFNLLGEKVETLYKGSGSAGLNSCFIDFSEIKNISSGSYIYGIYYNGKSKFKKMLYLK